MTKLFSFVALLAICLLTACGDDSKGKSSSAQKPTVIKSENICDLISEKNIKQFFPQAQKFTKTAFESPFPTCSKVFTAIDNDYRVTVSIQKGKGNADGLQQALRSYNIKEPVDSLGSEAYYHGDETGQVTVVNGDDIIQVSVFRGYDGSLPYAKDFAKMIMAELK